jgi:hypothetical protein
MSDRLYDFSGERTGVVTIPTIWVAVVLSLIIHLAVLWEWLPQLRLASAAGCRARRALARRASGAAAQPAAVAATGSFAVASAVIPRVAAAPSSPAAAPRSAAGHRRQAARPCCPVATIDSARPSPRRRQRRIDGDLASYVEARRRARADPAPSAPAASPVPAAPPVEDAKARADRLAAANLGSSGPLPFGYDPCARRRHIHDPAPGIR